MSAVESRADVAAVLLLTRWWSQPTDAERDAWDVLWEDARSAAESLEIDTELLDGLRAAVARADPELLLEEYERLLVGPGCAPCAPYESLWHADTREQGSLMGAPAEAVPAIYRGIGLDIRPDAHELPDHLLLECEALACALERAPAAARALLDDHLGAWIGPFCTAVAAAADEPFYVRLAELTPGWLAAVSG